MFKCCSHHCQKRSAPLCRNWELFKCLYQWLWHGAERGNNEWLEKLQCSSGVSHQCQKRSAPLRSNWEMYEWLWHGAERDCPFVPSQHRSTDVKGAERGVKCHTTNTTFSPFPSASLRHSCLKLQKEKEKIVPSRCFYFKIQNHFNIELLFKIADEILFWVFLLNGGRDWNGVEQGCNINCHCYNRSTDFRFHSSRSFWHHIVSWEDMNLPQRHLRHLLGLKW